MFFYKKNSDSKDTTNKGFFRNFFGNLTMQNIAISLITLIIVFSILNSDFANNIDNSKFSTGIKNNLKTFTGMNDVDNALNLNDNIRVATSVNILHNIDIFFNSLDKAKLYIALEKYDTEYSKKEFFKNIEQTNIFLSDTQAKYLLNKTTFEELDNFKTITKNIASNFLQINVTNDNYDIELNKLKDQYKGEFLPEELLEIGNVILNENLNEITNNYSFWDKTGNQKNFYSRLALFIIVVFLMVLIILYMRIYNKDILKSRNNLIILSSVVSITLLISKWISQYSQLAIPIFIATMVIAILLDLNLAIIVNFLLSIAISLIIHDDFRFLYMGLISGTFAAFFVHKTYQRYNLSVIGLILGLLNVIVICTITLINRSYIDNILFDCIIVFINGLVSIIFTIGILPTIESIFDIITPFRLLELTNPNQPLIKKLLIEAPGTYHHSLMVGNLAEAGAEAIGADSLLARVGAYYHDVGKLKRPNFFMENQLTDNPHDRMTPNLSALVITSHTHDGVEIAKKHKIPLAVRDIIYQHHGNTLIAFFYYKAKKGEKGDLVTEKNFRYPNSIPMTNEAAVVMLADCTEAAVRSMTDKTEGKIEGLIRKIIKSKLDDCQLDNCNLTLKDLDKIAKSFMKIFSGYFHAREEYPEKSVAIEKPQIKNSPPVSEKIDEVLKEEPTNVINLPVPKQNSNSFSSQNINNSITNNEFDNIDTENNNNITTDAVVTKKIYNITKHKDNTITMEKSNNKYNFSKVTNKKNKKPKNKKKNKGN